MKLQDSVGIDAAYFNSKALACSMHRKSFILIDFLLYLWFAVDFIDAQSIAVCRIYVHVLD
jgi:hypothetical protein